MGAAVCISGGGQTSSVRALGCRYESWWFYAPSFQHSDFLCVCEFTIQWNSAGNSTASHLQLQLKNMLHLSHFHFFLRKLTRILNSGKQFREPVYMTV